MEEVKETTEGWDFLQARIPVSLKVEFERACRKMGKSMTEVLIELLHVWLDRDAGIDESFEKSTEEE